LPLSLIKHNQYESCHKIHIQFDTTREIILSSNTYKRLNVKKSILLEEKKTIQIACNKKNEIRNWEFCNHTSCNDLMKTEEEKRMGKEKRHIKRESQ